MITENQISQNEPKPNELTEKSITKEQTLEAQPKPDSVQISISRSVNDKTSYNWGRFQSKPNKFLSFPTQLVLLASLGSFTFGFNIALLNTALETIAADIKICGDTELDCPSKKWWLAGVQTALLVGSALGALSAGFMIKHGRRFSLMIMMVFFVFGTIGSVTSTAIIPLLWARLVVGLGVGMVSVGSPTYISEVTPNFSRGFYGVFHQVAICTGILIPMLLGLPLTKIDTYSDLKVFHKIWWRLMLGFGLIPVILFLYFAAYIYTFETPVWYIENDRQSDSENLFQLIYNKSDVSEELNSTIESVRTAENFRKNKLSFFQLLASKKYRLVVFVGIMLAIFQQISGINYFMMSSKQSFLNANLSPSTAHIITIVMSFMNLVLTFPTIYLIDKFGRRSLFLAGSCAQCLFLLPATISYWLEEDVNTPGSTTQILSVVLVIGYVCAFALAFGPVVWVYLFEIYPIEIKDSAASIATAFNWAAAIVIVFVAQVIHNSIAYTVFTVFQITATLFILLFVRESKNYMIGKSPYIA